MSNEERAQIVRERWQCIDDSIKCFYVAMARYEALVDRHQKVQVFYSERIETAKVHAKFPNPDGLIQGRDTQSFTNSDVNAMDN